ncbi:MAG: DUF3276 family protein [Alistipes sp.]
MTPQTTPRRDAEEYGDQILTKAVKAGRRTYFSMCGHARRRLFPDDNREPQGDQPRRQFSYDRHKIFLYKEDFEKFSDGLSEVVAFIRRSKPEFFERRERERSAYSLPGRNKAVGHVRFQRFPPVGVWLWRGCFDAGNLSHASSCGASVGGVCAIPAISLYLWAKYR